MSEPSNGLGSQTRARVGVLLKLSSPSANLLKAWGSEGWSSDITMEVPGTFLMAVAGLLLSVGIELKRTGDTSRKDWRLILMGSFDVG